MGSGEVNFPVIDWFGCCVQVWGSRACKCVLRTRGSDLGSIQPSVSTLAGALSTLTAHPPISRFGTRFLLAPSVLKHTSLYCMQPINYPTMQLFEMSAHAAIISLFLQAGQESFRSLNLAYYRRAVAAILVYDITR
jgi:hypothetical protein